MVRVMVRVRVGYGRGRVRVRGLLKKCRWSIELRCYDAPCSNIFNVTIRHFIVA